MPDRGSPQQNHPCIVRSPRRAAAGKRMRNKCRLKNRIQNTEHGVVEHPVAHCGFVNMAQFRVLNVKTAIWPMPVRLVQELKTHLKNIFFQAQKKSPDIRLAHLPYFELIPSQKQIFRRNQIIKQVVARMYE
ncbi:MAG: hypothetical protein AAB671_02235 [Patescibacteria group bacterium]